MPDIIKGKASCWPIQEELSDNPYFKKMSTNKISRP